MMLLFKSVANLPSMALHPNSIGRSCNFILRTDKNHMKQIFFVLALLMSAQITFSQTLEKQLTHDGLQRDYRLYVPAIYDGSESVPVVLNLHGYTSNALQQELYSNFNPIADTANFILVIPDGTRDASNTTFWNAFGSPTETVDDIGFLSALIDTIALDYNIDMNRVYSTGMSNGGFMSYRLACALSSRIAAIASVTGAMVNPAFLPCNASHPTPVMQIHGTADPTVPYTGSTGVLGAEASTSYWVDYNNCNPTPVETAVPNISQTDLCTADHFVYSGGDAGSTVELYRVNGGGHTWPGAPIDIGVTNHDFSASVEIWRFFSQYRLNELVGVNEYENESSFVVFPNPSESTFTIRFETTENRTIQIHNAVGQLVRTVTANANAFELNLTEVGIYLLTVNSNEGMFTKKLIVK